MIWNAKKILVLSAHTDDMELGAGGTIRKFVKNGSHVKSIVFSDCKESVDTKNFPIDVLRSECILAAKHLGIEKPTIHEIPVRKFPEKRQDILELIYEQRKEMNPDIVFTTWTGDIHQDHRVVAEETLRAFMKTKTSVLAYEIPGNCPRFTPSVFFPLTEEDVESKISMLHKYESQVKRRGYFDVDAIRAQLGYHGLQIGEKYAEGFVVERGIVKGINGQS